MRPTLVHQASRTPVLRAATCPDGRGCEVVPSERLIAHTTNQTPQAIVTTTKLGGALNIAEITSPDHTAITLMSVDSRIASPGRGVKMMAVAAGVTTSAKSSSMPT